MSTEKLKPEEVLNKYPKWDDGLIDQDRTIYAYEESDVIKAMKQYADQQTAELQEKYNRMESQVKGMGELVLRLQQEKIEAVNLLDLLYGVVYLDYCDAYDIKTQVKLFLESLKPDQ